MSIRTLGVDLGIRAVHVATLCDSRGEVVWSKRRFGNRHDRTHITETVRDQRNKESTNGHSDTEPLTLTLSRNPLTPVRNS